MLYIFWILPSSSFCRERVKNWPLIGMGCAKEMCGRVTSPPGLMHSPVSDDRVEKMSGSPLVVFSNFLEDKKMNGILLNHRYLHSYTFILCLHICGSLLKISQLRLFLRQSTFSKRRGTDLRLLQSRSPLFENLETPIHVLLTQGRGGAHCLTPRRSIVNSDVL